ncbi:MAG: ATP-binding protein [Planctomycetota bacterium]
MAQDGRWRVALPVGDPPFANRNPDGDGLIGLYADWWRVVAAAAAAEVELIGCDSREACEALLLEGAADFAGPMQSRQWSRLAASRPVARRFTTGLYRSGTGAVLDAQDLRGRRVVTVGLGWDDLLELKRWDAASIDVMAGGEARGRLAAGRADVLVSRGAPMERAGALADAGASPLWFRWQHVWAAVDARDGLQEVDAAVDAQAARLSAIESRWIPFDGPSTLLGRAERPLVSPEAAEWLADHPTVLLGASDWVPLTVPTETGYDGLVLRVVSHHLRQAGLTPIFDGQRDWERVKEGADAGVYDGLGYLVARRRSELLLSESMLDLPMVVIARSDAPFWSGPEALRDSRVVANGDYGEVGLLREQGVLAAVVPESDPRRALDLLQRGAVDAWIEYLPIAESWIRAMGARDVKLALRLAGPNQVFLALRPEWRTVMPLVNASIRSMSVDTLNQIYARWNARVQRAASPFARWLWFAAAIILALLVGVLALFGRLSRAHRTTRQRELALRRAQLLSGVGSFELPPPHDTVLLDGETPRLLQLADRVEVQSLDDHLRLFGNPAAMRHAIQQVHGGTSPVRFDMVTDDEPPRTFAYELAMPDGERPRGVITGTLQNVTRARVRAARQKELEAEVLQLQKLDAVGQLAHGIAHEFNNILAASIAHTEIALQALPAGHRAHDSLEAVLLASERSRDLVRRILAFSREHAEEHVPLRWDQVVRETIALLRASIPSTVRLHVSLTDDPVWVVGDGTQLSQVLVNLVTNAVDAVEADGTVEIRLGVADNDGAAHAMTRRTLARLTVIDDGCGIDDAVRGRMFDPFVTTKPAGEGSGLGLAIVHGVVRAHAGQIEALPGRSGSGSRFVVTLPATEPGLDAAPQAAPVEEGRGRTVMLVDDEPLLVDVFGKVLDAHGFRVSAFASANAALESLRQPAQRYDVVLTDLTMPDMTGIEFAHRVREIDAEVPLVLITGYGVPQGAHDESLFQVVLEKPLRGGQLVEGVHRAFRRERPGAARSDSA